MSTQATELQKLLELRDKGAVSDAEFEKMRARILSPERHAAPNALRRESRTLVPGVPNWMLAAGGLIGGTALLAMTEVGALALGAIIVVGLFMILFFAFSDTFL